MNLQSKSYEEIFFSTHVSRIKEKFKIYNFDIFNEIDLQTLDFLSNYPDLNLKCVCSLKIFINDIQLEKFQKIISIENFFLISTISLILEEENNPTTFMIKCLRSVIFAKEIKASLEKEEKAESKISIYFGENSKKELRSLLSESTSMLKQNEMLVSELFNPLNKSNFENLEFHKADIIYLLKHLVDFEDFLKEFHKIESVNVLEKDFESDEKVYLLMLFNEIFPNAEVFFYETN